MNPRDLVTPRRLDIAVKWRMFEALGGRDDPQAMMFYRWHIEERVKHRWRQDLPMDGWKRSPDDYVASAKALFVSMKEKGYLPEHPVPVDPSGEILGGAHRIACAIALGIERIAVEHKVQDAWAAPWGAEWFLSKNIGPAQFGRVMADFRGIRGGMVAAA